VLEFPFWYEAFASRIPLNRCISRREQCAVKDFVVGHFTLYWHSSEYDTVKTSDHEILVFDRFYSCQLEKEKGD
jgi:hypothetical protein